MIAANDRCNGGDQHHFVETSMGDDQFTRFCFCRMCGAQLRLTATEATVTHAKVKASF